MAESTQSFTLITETTPTMPAPEIEVGILGYGFMGKAYLNGFKKLPCMMYPPVRFPS